MTAETGEALRGEAIGWHLRIADGSLEDWEAFTAWLEASPENGRAYDRIEALDAEAGGAVAAALPPALVAANDDTPVPVRRRWLGGAAVAASVALAVLVGTQLVPGRDLYRVESAPGAIRSVVLASGDSITLNGDSSVMLDRRNVRFASLERGEASFAVTHNPDAPFVVEVGDERIQDVGTEFNVTRGADGVQLAVAKGVVLYNPGREAVRLQAGQALQDPGGSGAIVLARVDPANVGSWRSHRLSYDGAPLQRVTADLSRATGQRIRIAPALAMRPFSGTIRLPADGDIVVDDVAQLLGTQARRDGDGWTLVARPRAAN